MKTIKHILVSGLLILSAAYPLAASDFTALRDNDPAVRSREAYRLGQEKVIESVPALLELLNDEVSGPRLNAIVSLGMIADERAVDPLLYILENDELPAARAMAAEALYGFEDERINSALSEAAESENDNIRYSAVKVLGRTRPQGNIPKLLNKAEKDPDWSVREEAVKALRLISLQEEGNEDVRDDIESVMRRISRHDSNSRVKDVAGKAYSDIRDASGKRSWWPFR